MKPLANSPKQRDKSNQAVIPGPGRPVAPGLVPSRTPAPQPHATRPAMSSHCRATASAGGRAQANVAGHPSVASRANGAAAIQQRGALPRAGANRPDAVVNQHEANRPTAAATPKAPNYNVQPPIHLGGRSQQIRATIQGTPQVAGSVEISAAGPGKAYISNLKVDQQHRRRGVAAKLIDAAINTARRQGFSAASLEARPSDNGITPQTLVAMYRRKGFKSVGKSGRGSPLMERKL